jgi:glycosyltransferase involved in cell wall biosynthesis
VHPKVIVVSRCAWTLFNFRANLIKALKLQNFNVLGAGAGGDGFEERVRSLGVPFVSIPVDKKGINPLADLWLAIQLFRLYRSSAPQVVHHFTIKPVIFGGIAARIAGVPRVIATITGLGYAFTEQRGALRWIVQWLYRLALSKAHTVFFQNVDDLTLFVSRGLVDPKVCRLTPGSGVDLMRFSPTPTPAHDTGRPVHCLMIARMLRDKGLFEFIDALNILRNRGILVSGQLLGGIDERNPSAVSRDTIEGWVKSGLVTWTDHVSDVRPHIASADIVVLPSYREGVPRSLLEAAAMAKPLVSTDVPGCRDVVVHGLNGLLVPPKNAEALANAIAELAASAGLRKEMGLASREHIERKFDERHVINITIDQYQIGNIHPGRL